MQTTSKNFLNNPTNPSVRPVDFDSIRLRLASPENINDWSYGEVTKPETINYRTQKPEKDGLFDERIFGPTKDWECYCGKYKRIRHKGIVCDKCGVEVTRSLVRRERMGHIGLAAPVSHIWFLRGVPSKIGLVLDLSVQDLEKVIYFASFIITNVDEQKKQDLLDQVKREYKSKLASLNKEESDAEAKINKELSGSGISGQELETRIKEEKERLAGLKAERLSQLEKAMDVAKKEISSIVPLAIISENAYQDLSIKYGHVFDAGIGAEAIYGLLQKFDINIGIKSIVQDLEKAKGGKRKKCMRRLKLLQSLLKTGIKPEWMIMVSVPVIPPDLRPMVQLDGGRFATSDLNDLYRRVINRNNRLKRLKDLNAPEVISRNEKRMLQEAVDALIDNGARHGKTVTASTGQRRVLKSIADMLKGKQGRFRQNLLGKRIDYSGRSVIVVGPNLKLRQCGLPKTMALELFKPFVISKLIAREIVHNVRSANKYIEAGHSEVWDILEQVTKKSYVFLNRAPTLHRLGIQAFQPVLIEGKAIQVHPLVCSAFNADFDGDQMAVHVPLTEEAQKEAGELMLSSLNILKPATGEPVVSPGLDIVFGCYFITQVDESKKVYPRPFSSISEAKLAYENGVVSLNQKVKVSIDGKTVETTIGRIIFNEVIPKEIPFVNEVMGKKALKVLVGQCFHLCGVERTGKMLDEMMRVGFKYATVSGMSWAINDLPELSEKTEILKEAQKEVDDLGSQYEEGLLTDEERHAKVIEIWARVKTLVTERSQKVFEGNIFNPVYTMIESGARGSWGQTTQMMGMKGLVTSPSGATIELPVKANFKEGFDVLEYFISTHGARKGLTDTALRTANAGYLTRRLIDVAQDIITTENDCGDKIGWKITKEESAEMGETISERIWGRTVLEDIKDKNNKLIVKKGELVSYEAAQEIGKLDLDSVLIRSVLTCDSRRGICQKCYGYDLAHNKLVELGTAVGIIAAQSIGEPGTQLTMRTFHTGGVASDQDITQGLPRVEEIFEARHIQKGAIVSEVRGKIESVRKEAGQKVIVVKAEEEQEEKYLIEDAEEGIRVKDGERVKKGDVLFSDGDNVQNAGMDGVVKITKKYIKVLSAKGDSIEYSVPLSYAILAKEGDLVNQGDVLTEGSVDPHDLYLYRGQEAVQKYVLREIQNIYSSQGQKLNDKHLEIMARQIFSRVYIKEAGDSDFLPGEVIERSRFDSANKDLKAENKKEATGEVLLLGVTKASLSTESFLSAASFQETARVLIDASISGKVDYLKGLKENVIIGRLIPAGTGFEKDK